MPAGTQSLVVLEHAEATGVRLHIVHVASSCIREVPQCLAAIDSARARGVQVTTEAYPYGSGSTAIGPRALGDTRYDAVATNRRSRPLVIETANRLLHNYNTDHKTKQLVDNLDLILARRGMTLSELAERVGITLPNMSILKTNKARAIRFSTLEAICRELDCQPGDLLEYDAPPGPAEAGSQL